MMRIQLFCALPQECASLKKMMGGWSPVDRKPFRSFVTRLADRELVLVETGMGEASIRKALEWSARAGRPDMLISFGFAGGLSEAHRVAEVYLGVTHSVFRTAGGPGPEGKLLLDASPELLSFCRENGVGALEIVTTPEVQPKGLLRRHYADRPCLVEMESYFAARLAWQEEIPFLCFRAVSDELHEEIDFDVSAISCPKGRIRLWKVAGEVLKRPSLLRTFYSLNEHSVRAGRRLGQVLYGLLNLPDHILENLVLANRLRSP